MENANNKGTQKIMFFFFLITHSGKNTVKITVAQIFGDANAGFLTFFNNILN
jgi:hypothetical protein